MEKSCATSEIFYVSQKTRMSDNFIFVQFKITYTYWDFHSLRNMCARPSEITFNLISEGYTINISHFRD